MTPKLSERLARLEAARAMAIASVSMPPELVETNLYAVAIALGGYPRAPEPASSCRQDSISDGFARGLGYIDRDDMEARCAIDPDDWQARIEAAHAALIERYVQNPSALGLGRDPMFQMMVGTLDEIRHAKAARSPGTPHHWPSECPKFDWADASIRRALTFFGMSDANAERTSA
ncbi:hypothetical protein SAMN05216360_12545 [Methylobacterium phyllostachyos]|uniref:Uncharacterized protein n=1 Tax=Methylobacterium phyllostachyos TaxID=582672 RepID=A0A1H0K8T9_9HYPH|nr:hypothetical protein [Methylobacterium phyllostachyos]SDO52309.1 hypothetical protein SAMN05216360_12545 [Methylobacterium phyllostachyos]